MEEYLRMNATSCPQAGQLTDPSSVPRATPSTRSSLAEQLPDMEIGELVYSENIGTYSGASSTYFNGFPRPRSCM
jgi:hypothetical protein